MNCSGRSIRLPVRLKYCGNRSASDLRKSLQSKADYIGLIFAESKRKVEVEEVKQWLQTIEHGKKQLVGVFVNAPTELVANIASQLPLAVIQCHGHETAAHVAAIKEATGLAVWKAIHHDEDAVRKMQQYAGVADGYVVDSRVSGAWGGTGVAFDWCNVPLYLEEAARQAVPCFIAGGITPENVERLLAYRPYGIDISSGIEENEEKSVEKMKEIEKKVANYV
jgi:phosphoribosylanthranilate isomerase